MGNESVLSIREMLNGIFHFWDDHISGDGAWWILALDAVFFIPAIFAMFFYPVEVLTGLVVVAALTLGVIALRRAIHVRHPGA